jgi:hypothetical protein
LGGRGCRFFRCNSSGGRYCWVLTATGAVAAVVASVGATPFEDINLVADEWPVQLLLFCRSCCHFCWQPFTSLLS